eukprot:GHRR01033944.1.p1 GENE.GHRR01033944.1~~GHRR01033944.1.p1  ORF type:complete len:378 (+),score=104.44 GHRR01033944.1:542-1675(+)
MDGGGYYNRTNDYRGGWRGGGRGAGRYGDRYDGYQQGGRGYYQGGRDQYYDGGGGGRGRGGSYYDGGRGRGRQYDDGGHSGRGSRNSRYNWGRGRQSGPPPAQRRRDTLPDDVVQLTELKKHERQVTCLYYDPATQQLYSGSSDGSICAWSCSSGQLTHSDIVAPYGVDSIRVEGGFMFVGLSKADEGIVKVYNLQTGTSHQLTGHKGQVYGLAVANNALFSAGQDCSIRVWQYNETAGIFMSQAILNATNGDGHRHAVYSLTVLGQYMFSGDRSGALKVWDLAQGLCVQTVQRAHDNAITSITGWGENYLLTSSMDGTIKVWSPGSSPTVILNTQPEFRYPEDDTQSSSRGGYRQQQVRYWLQCGACCYGQLLIMF